MNTNIQTFGPTHVSAVHWGKATRIDYQLHGKKMCLFIHVNGRLSRHHDDTARFYVSESGIGFIDPPSNETLSYRLLLNPCKLVEPLRPEEESWESITKRYERSQSSLEELKSIIPTTRDWLKKYLPDDDTVNSAIQGALELIPLVSPKPPIS